MARQNYTTSREMHDMSTERLIQFAAQTRVEALRLRSGFELAPIRYTRQTLMESQSNLNDTVIRAQRILYSRHVGAAILDAIQRNPESLLKRASPLSWSAYEHVF